MRKLISILLIVACLITFGACAKKNNPEVNPDPGVTQGGDNSGTQGEGTITFAPAVTTEPGVNLEEDILSGDETTVSATPAPENSGIQETPSSEKTDAVEPTATPVVKETPSVITLPFDAF